MKKIILMLFVGLLPMSVQASDYLFKKPVKIVLTIGVGSAPDIVARKMAEILTEKWKVPVIVENKPGGAGIVGLHYINSMPADGHTLGFLDSAPVIAYQVLYNNKQPIGLLEPVMPLTDTRMLLVVSSQIESFNDLKKEISKNPSYGSWNVGSIGHLLGAQLASLYNANAQHVPYREIGIWQTDIANQTVPFGFGSFGSTKSLVQGKKNQWMAIAARQRDPMYPSIPTVKELTGQDIYSFNGWCAFYISKQTPRKIKIQLEKDLRDAANDPRVQQTMINLGNITLNNLSTKEFETIVSNDYKKYKELVKKYKISIQPK